MELTLDQALQKGVEAHKAGKAEEADRYYTAILKANPKHPDANHNMGVLAAGVGKVEQALPFFKTALEGNPNIAQYWLSYIDALIKLGRLDDAKAVSEQAKSNGAKGDGFDQLELRLNTSSVEVKNQTQEDIPTPPNILDELKLDQALKVARKKVRDGMREEAKRIYKDILKKFPKNKNALDGIKTLASKALANMSEMQEPPGHQLQSLVNLYTQGQYQQALTQASQLLKDFSSSINLYNIIGAANKGLGKLEKAIEAYTKVISIKPDFADAYNNMGNALKEQGKPDEAIDAYTKALSIQPNFADAYNNMGIVLQGQGKPDEAIDAYTKALSIQPDFADAYNNMGVILQGQGKPDEAIDAYNKAFSLKPDYAEAYNNMGVVLQGQGKPDEAIDAYTKALSIQPDFADAYNNMGNALKEQGKPDEAIDAYTKALSIQPNFADAHNNITELLKVYAYNSNETHSIFKIDSKIKQLSSRLISAKSNKEIIKYLVEGLSYISVDECKFKTPLSQIYKRNSVDLNCKRHKKIFDTKNIIPEFCFGCFKVQVEVPQFIDLVKLTSLFYKIDFVEDLTRKTFVELRPNIPGHYKGLIYCSGLDQAEVVRHLLDSSLDEIVGKKILSKIKRGCSEYSLEFPDYGKIDDISEGTMNFPKEWKQFEEKFDQKKLIEPIKNTPSSLAEFCLSDFYILQKWIDYAKGIGDRSIETFNDVPIIFKDIYEQAKRRA